MEKLLKSTTAYKIFSADRASGRLSHAYMLHFADTLNLRTALKIFAKEFFGADGALAARIESESYSDLIVYPAEGKKISVDGISEIIEDSALRPVEGDKKLYIIVGFEGASALVQNKLLKTLEEPLSGIYFLLGVTTLAPVLDTVVSRVKMLEVPPFTVNEVYEALERQGANPDNLAAAKSCNGILGAAQNMVSGGWFKEVREAANAICSVNKVSAIFDAVKKYGEIKYKQELLSEMQNIYFSALTEGGELNKFLQKHTILFALEELTKANADLKFNAYFQGLLHDFMLKVVRENDKWLKLQG
ncbi:MAG: hypothetical protein J1F61_03510 [Clostridiales bacterium]|nr:hypothetical protein [Clostridiales bacterium]